jgi:plastocyanin
MRHRIALSMLLTSVAMADCTAEPPPRAPIAKPASPARIGYSAVAVLASAGSLSGTVSYSGVTRDAPVAVDRDKLTCGPAAEGLSGALTVTEGRVANAVVEVIGVTEGAAFEPQTIQVDTVGCMFVPRVALARVGDTFLSHNSDPVFHNAKLDLITRGRTKRIANLPVPLQGSDSAARVLKKPGVIKVTCDAHLWMRASIYVTAHPYSALTGPDGSFTIPDLLPGQYTVKVWHEVLGETTAPVTIKANAEARAELSL